MGSGSGQGPLAYLHAGFATARLGFPGNTKDGPARHLNVDQHQHRHQHIPRPHVYSAHALSSHTEPVLAAPGHGPRATESPGTETDALWVREVWTRGLQHAHTVAFAYGLCAAGAAIGSPVVRTVGPPLRMVTCPGSGVPSTPCPTVWPARPSVPSRDDPRWPSSRARPDPG